MAKRIRPMLGVKFGQREYIVTILKDVEEEVHRSPALRFKFPWFDDGDLAAERMAATIRLSAEEKEKLSVAQSVLHGWVLADISRYTTGGRSPPSPVDCRVLAFGQIRQAVIVTDDIGMHDLAKDFGITVWHGSELLAKMRTAKMVSNELIREIFDALEANGDQTTSWRDAKHTTFAKIFGAPKKGK